MKLKQISLFLENKPGSLSRPCQVLAKAKLNILTLSVADSQSFGIMRLILQDWEKAKTVLEKAGFIVKVTNVIAIEVPDHPGGLAELLLLIEKAGVNVEYMYAFTVKNENKGMLVFRFDDTDRAIEALQKKKINVISSVELYERLAN